MINVTPLTDCTPLLDNPDALRKRWEEEGVLFFRGLIDPELMGWAREKFRSALAAEGLIDLTNETPIWTGEAPKTRRPCDAIGTTVWHEIMKQPKLNQAVRGAFGSEPVWIPIVAHRSFLPTGPVAEGTDIFHARHQDGFTNEGVEFAICWMPIMDIDMNSGNFAVAPGTHARGLLHEPGQSVIDPKLIDDDTWRAAEYRVGDVVMFNFFTAHAPLPNPSNLIRMSIDLRVIPGSAPQPIVGTVEAVDGTHVSIHTDSDEHVVVHVNDNTLIRDMHPYPRFPTSEVQKIAFPGARVLAMIGNDGNATVLRRNFY